MIPLRDNNPVERFPIVTYVLLFLNLLAFAWQLGLPEVLASPDLLAAMGMHLGESVQRGGVVPYEILTFRDVELRNVVPPPFTVVTSMFLHGGIGHLAFNMLFLWIFGNNVEDALGRLRFLAFYGFAGVAAALVQVVASAMTGDILIPMVGASGAIAGVLAAYMVLFPHARVLTLVIIVILIRIVPLPAGWFIGIWFAGQLLSVFFGASTGVAFFAHIGGFVVGFLLVRTMGRRRGWRVRPRAYW